MSAVRHKILTQADPELVIDFSSGQGPRTMELTVYGGTFGGAVVKVSRRLAATDELGNALAYVDMQTPDLQDPLSISAAGGGYVFSDLASCGQIKVAVSGAGGTTSVTVGVGF